MSDKGSQGPLQSLFSGDSLEEGESAESPIHTRAADLSISGLFYSLEGDDRHAESAAEAIRDGAVVLPGCPPGMLAADESGVAEGSPEERPARARAAAEAQSAIPLSFGSGATTAGPRGSGAEIRRDLAATGMAEAHRPAAYATTAEPSIDLGLAEACEPILNAVLALATAGGGVLLALWAAEHVQRSGGLLRGVPVMVGYLLLAAAFVLRRRVPSRWRVAILVGVSYAAAVDALCTQGGSGVGAWYLLGIPILLFVLAGERYGLASAIASAAIYIVCVVLHRLGWPANAATVDADSSLPGSVALVVTLSLMLAAIAIVHSLLGRIEGRMRRALRQHDDVLAAVRTAGVERQQSLERANADLSRQLRIWELGTEMGRLGTMGLHLDELISRAVELIRENTEAGYVGLYLLDADRTYGQLYAEAGAGRQIGCDPGERIRVLDDVLLRQCVSSGRPQVLRGIDDVQGLVGSESGSPFLHPDTRSALALPLVARGSVFGAVSVQSRAPAAFDNVDVTSLRTAVDQLATAVSNAQLAQQLGEQLERLERLQQYYVRVGWERFLGEGHVSTYEYHRPELKPLGEARMPEVEHVLSGPRLVALDEGDASALLVPIVMRENVLGVLGLQRLQPDQPWTEEQLELLAALAEQMGLTMENARLFAEARSRAAQERRVRQIVARLRQSLDVEEVLSMAVQEIGDALHLEDVAIRLTRTEEAVEGRPALGRG